MTQLVAAAILVALVLLAVRLRSPHPLGSTRSRVELELDRVRAASRLLAQAQDQLSGRSLPSTLEELLHEVRGWLASPSGAGGAGSPDEPDVIALRPGDHAERYWVLLGADDVVRTSDRHQLPAALLGADTGTPTVLVPDVTPGDGLHVTSRRAAYLWLGVGGGRVAVLALEWDRPGDFSSAELRTLEVLRVLLEELAAAVSRLRRIRDDAQAGERQRLAAQLHDHLGQDLAYLVVELSRAERRHPDDPELRRLTATFRDAVAGVRTTIGELRHPPPGRVTAPARRIARHLAADVPCQVTAMGAADPCERRREDVAVACVVAIVRTVAQRAHRVTIGDTSEVGDATLEVRLDGALVDPRHPQVAAAVSAGQDVGVVIDVQGRRSGTWLIVRLPEMREPADGGLAALPDAEETG